MGGSPTPFHLSWSSCPCVILLVSPCVEEEHRAQIANVWDYYYMLKMSRIAHIDKKHFVNTAVLTDQNQYFASASGLP